MAQQAKGVYTCQKELDVLDGGGCALHNFFTECSDCSGVHTAVATQQVPAAISAHNPCCSCHSHVKHQQSMAHAD